MLGLRRALLSFKPFASLDAIYSDYSESPGIEAYSKRDAISLFHCFLKIHINNVLTHGDLLQSGVGQCHSDYLLNLREKFGPGN